MIKRVHPSGRHLAQLAVAVVLLAGLPGASIAAEDLRLEAEEFRAYGSYNIGGEGIRESYCSYASGGLAVDGLDIPGEWFKLKVSFASAGCYSSKIDYQSAYDDTVQLVVRLLDYPAPMEELRANYLLIDGFGFG